MATERCRFTLHVPSMWMRIARALSRGNASFRDASFRDHIEILPLPVSETGISDKHYSRIGSDSQDHLNILMLPVAHCALNIVEHRLSIIGPAIATRNDIFVFRTRSQIESLVGPFIVGTKEVDLTSSNIFRIVIANWPADILFYADPMLLKRELRVLGPQIRKHLIENLKCEAQDNPSRRLERLVKGQYHAAVFTGEELRVKLGASGPKESLFQCKEVIDVLNLNRRINSLYHVRSLPRAVLCVRGDTPLVQRGAIDEFAEIYNAAVAHVPQRAGNESEGRQQTPLAIGPNAVKGEIETLIRFTEDMHSKLVRDWRRRDIPDSSRAELIDASRALKRRDFTYWNVTYRERYERAIVDQISLVYERASPGRRRDDILSERFPNLVQERLSSLSEVPADHQVLAKWISGLGANTSVYSFDELLVAGKNAADSVDVH